MPNRTDRSPANRRIRRAGQLMLALEPRIVFDGSVAAAAAAVADPAHALAQDAAQRDTSQRDTPQHAAAAQEPSPRDSLNTKDVLARDVPGARAVVFIDGGVADIATLVSAAPAGTSVVILDTQADGIAQIGAYLAAHDRVDTVHIVSHGAAGEVRLGQVLLTSGNIGQYSVELAQWRAGLAPGADVMIYGCDVAAGSNGQQFIGQLAQLTGANIAASTDNTGSAEWGGNWQLEAGTGAIDSHVLDFGATGWSGELAVSPTVYFDNGFQLYAGTSNAASTTTNGFDASDSYGWVQGAYINSSTMSFTASAASTSTAGTFQGNDVTGTLTFSGTFKDANGATQTGTFTLSGAFSRNAKTGSTTNSLYFWADTTNASNLQGLAFQCIVPTKESNYGSSYPFKISLPANNGFLADLNTLLATQQGYSAAITAGNDTASLYSGNSTTGNVLTNDSTTNAFTLTVADAAAGAGTPVGGVGSTLTGTYGQLTVSSSGAYTYNANGASVATGASATDTFTYQVEDSHGGFKTATLTVTVNGAGPRGTADTGTATQGLTTTVATAGGVLSNDTDSSNRTLTVSGVAAGSAGSAPSGNVGSAVTGAYGSLTLASDGSYSYTANNAAALAAGATATDTFTYALKNTNNDTTYTTLTITVTGTNDTPAAVADTGSATASQTTTVASGSGVLANDSDADSGDSIAVTGVVAGTGTPSGNVGSSLAGAYGHLTLNANGSYTYVADNASGIAAGATANDVFTYKVADSSSASATSTLTITVTGVDTTAPSAPGLALDASSDSGASSSDAKTNDDTPSVRVTLNGSGATAPVAGDTVQVYLGSAQVGTATLTSTNISNGYVDITTSTLGADGSKSLTATVTDQSSNVSSASSALALTLDTTAPALSAATVSGTTLVLTYTESGVGMDTSAPSAADFTVTKGSGNTAVTVGSVAVDTSAKTVTLTLGSSIVNTDTNILVSYTGGSGKTADIAGNLAASFSSQSVTNNSTDTTAPSAPGLALNAASDSGASSSDAKTSDDTPSVRVSLNGSGSTAPVAGDTVQVYLGSAQVGTATLTSTNISNGYVDITTSTLGSDGGKSLTATVTDQSSNVSSASSALALTLDTTAPALSAASVSGTTLVLTYTESGVGMGTSAPSASDFTVTKGSGNSVVTVSSVAIDTTAKTVTLTLGSAITNADTNVLVSYTGGSGKTQDIAGNAAASFTNQSVTNNSSDTTAPSAPGLALNAVSDSGASSSDAKTSDDTPSVRVSLNGSGVTAPVAGDTVQVYLGSAQVGTATLTSTDISNGYVDITTSTLGSDGGKSLTATVTDQSSNVSSASSALALTVDTTAPALSAASVSGTTLVLTYTESGVGMDTSAPSASDFTVTKGSGNSAVTVSSVAIDTTAKTVTLTLGSAITNADTNVLVSYTGGSGKTQDIAGNAAVSFTNQSVTNNSSDTTAPSAPGLALNAASDSGASSSDAKTSDDTPSVRVSLNGSGTTAPVAGDTVKVYLGSTQVGTATLAAGDITNGYVDITTSTLGSDGSKSLTATVTDQSSNVSSASSALALTLDTTAPALSTATVSGTTLVLTYTESGVGMDTSAPSASDFTVTKGSGNSAVTVSSVAIDTTAKTVTLTLGSAITNADTNVLVSYTGGSGKTQDIAGNAAASFTNQSVTNNSSDTTAPSAPGLALNAVSDSGASSSDAKTSDDTPSVRVSLNGSGSTAPVAGDTVQVYLGSAQVGTATLTSTNISNGYVDITTSTLGSDGGKSLTATVTDQSSNVSSASSALALTLDTTAPALSAASVSGTTLVLTYTESGVGMDTSAPSASDFTVTKGSGNSAVTVSSVAIDTTAKTVTLTLGSSVTNADTNVLVSYTGGSGKTQDIAGNAAASFTNQSVTNSSIDTTAPSAPGLSLNAASDSGASSSDAKTSDDTPSVRVTLNGSGVTAPVAGDTVKVYLGSTQVGTATLAAGDITNGYVDITTSTLGSDGGKSLTATVTDQASNVSSASSALALTLDTTAPALTSAAVNGATLVLTYTESGVGMDTSTPSASDFTVTKGSGNSAVTVSGVAVDTTAKTVTLTLANAVTNADTNILVSYTGGSGKTEDIAGNLAVSFSNQPVTNTSGDTTAPAAPSLALNAVSDTGSSSADRITRQTAPSIRVTLAGNGVTAPMAGDTVKLYSGVSQVGTATLATADIANGYVDITTAALGNDGVKSLTATVTDQANNTSAPSAALAVTLDTTIATPTVALAQDTGASATDTITRDPTLVFSAPAQDVTRTYSINGGASAGSYVAPDVDGRYTVTVTDTDTAGNTASASTTFTLDRTIAPPSVALVNDTGTAGDNITSDASLTFSGVAGDVTRAISLDGAAASGSYQAPSASGAHTVVVTDTDIAGNQSTASMTFTLAGNVAAPAIALATDSGDSATDRITNDGAIQVSPPAQGIQRTYSVDGGSPSASYTVPAQDGQHTVVVTDTDSAGTTASSSLTYLLDRTIATPSVALATDSGDSASDLLTNAAGLNVSAPAADVTRTYSVDGGPAGAAYVAPAVDGAHTVVIRDTDKAGNTASASLSFTLDRTIATPVLALANDTGSSNTDLLTRDAALNVSPAAADVTRSYVIDGGAPVSAYTAPANDGSHTVQVIDRDKAGNSASATLTFTLDRTIATPAIALVTDSGASATDLITNQPAVNISAAGQGVTRVVTVDNGPGAAGYVAPSADGAHTVTVTDTDSAGNTARASLTFTLDTVVAAPQVALANDTGTSATDRITSDPSLAVGAAAEQVTRTYAVDGGAAAGSYAAPAANGLHTVVVTDTDLAGNTRSTQISFTLDNQSPQLAFTPQSATTTETSPTLSGTGADSLAGISGLTVTLTRNGDTRTATAVIVDGKWSVQVAGLSEGDWQITLSGADSAGNRVTVPAGAITVAAPPVVQPPVIQETPPVLAKPVVVPAAPAAPVVQPVASVPSPAEAVAPAAVPVVAALPVADISLPAVAPQLPEGGTFLVASTNRDSVAGEAKLLVANPPPAMTAELGKQSEVQLPSGVFRNTDPNARVEIGATLADGRPLPAWLTFDPGTGKFSGTPPASSAGSLDIKVTARDDGGNAANVQFQLTVRSGAANTDAGQPAAANAPAGGGTPGATAESRDSGAARSSVISFGPATVDSAAAAGAAQAAPMLFVADQPPPSETTVGKALNYQLPGGVFRHTDPSATASTEATMPDGSPLPAWLKYDPNTGKLSGVPPASAVGSLEIKIIAHDNAGRSASVTVKIQVAERDRQDSAQHGAPERHIAVASPDGKAVQGKAAPAGRAGLSAQLAKHGVQGRAAAQAQLLGQLQKLPPATPGQAG